MSDSYEKRDTLPMTWWGRVPIYATTMIVVIDLLSMFFCVFHASAHGNEGATILTFGFFPELFWKDWHFWQLFTYPLVNFPNFFYIFGLFFFFSFGIGIESYLGRRVFLRILVLLMLVPPLVTSLWMWLGMGGRGTFGLHEISIGVFVAYATLYPNVEYWNWITMKWLAFAGILLSSLMYFSENDWEGLSILLAVCGAAHALVRYERGHWALPSFRFPKKRPKLRVVPKPSATPGVIPRQEVVEDFTDVEVDALLDKIAKSGISSLTSAERARLEKAREELLKKERE